MRAFQSLSSITTAVAANSPAVLARLEAEDVLQAIGDKPLTSYNQLLEEIRISNDR